MSEREPRAGRTWRVRCPNDDATMAHSAVDLHGPFEIGVFARVAHALKRCACGADYVVLAQGAPEPAEANAAAKAGAR